EEAAERVEADRGTAHAVDFDEAPIERVAPRELRPKRGEAFALETSERRAEVGEQRRGDDPAVETARAEERERRRAIREVGRKALGVDVPADADDDVAPAIAADASH